MKYLISYEFSFVFFFTVVQINFTLFLDHLNHLKFRWSGVAQLRWSLFHSFLCWRFFPFTRRLIVCFPVCLKKWNIIISHMFNNTLFFEWWCILRKIHSLPQGGDLAWIYVHILHIHNGIHLNAQCFYVFWVYVVT